MNRYRVRKREFTKMQKRLYPTAYRRPYVVMDDATGRPVGLPDTYGTRSGAQVRADRMNKKEDETMQCSDPGPHGPHTWKDENATVHSCPGRS